MKDALAPILRIAKPEPKAVLGIKPEKVAF